MPRITPGFRNAALTIAALLAAYPRFVHGSSPTNYIGPDNGLWSDPLNWSSGVPTSSAFDVLINIAPAVTVQLDSPRSINNLSLSSPDTLSLLSTLLLEGGSFSNTGTLLFNATASAPILYLNLDSTLSGAGTVLMASTASKIIGASGARLTTDNLISGSGIIGNGSLKITNSGTISATSGILTVSPYTAAADGFINTGTLQAKGGSLVLSGGIWVNSGGIIQALNGSTVAISGTLTGGLVEGVGGTVALGVFNGATTTLRNGVSLAGTIVSPGAGSFTDTLSNSGTWTLANSFQQSAPGNLFNTGVINLQSTAGSNVSMQMVYGGSLTGGGTLLLTSNSLITLGGFSPTYCDNIIEGRGTLTTSNSFTNSGMIIATAATLALSASIFENAGVLRADGGVLLISGGALPALDNTNGVIEAVNGSEVTDTKSINGGIIRTQGPSIVAIAPTSGSITLSNGTLSNVSGTMTLAGTIQLQNETLVGSIVASSSSLIVTGLVQNTGTLALNLPQSQSITLNATAGSIANTGTIMIGPAPLYITAANATSTGLANSGTIILNAPTSEIAGNSLFSNSGIVSGSGFIGDPHVGRTDETFLTIVNSGTITATAGSMTITSPGKLIFTNTGDLCANGGTLYLSQVMFSNTNGLIEATNGSPIFVGNNNTNQPDADVVGGTIQAMNGSSISLYGSFHDNYLVILGSSSAIYVDNLNASIYDNASATISHLESTGLLFIQNAARLVLSGTLNNAGIIQISNLHGAHATSAADLDSGTTTLTGGGTLLMTPPSATNSTYNAPIFVTLFSQTLPGRLVSDNLVTGAGTIGPGASNATSSNLSITNYGSIVAPAMQTITVWTPNASDAFLNFGVLRADGGTLVLQGGPISNSAATIDARNGGQVSLRSVVTGGTLSASNAGVTFSSGGEASRFDALSLSTNGAGSFASTLNLNDNKFILQSDPTISNDKSTKASFLQSALFSGMHGGDWLGTGITSGTVAADNSATGSHLTTLALFDNADLGFATFGGQSADSNSLLITTALIGDSNLDGRVDAVDFENWYANVLARTPFTDQGDFNHDGAVDGLDFDLWFAAAGAGAQPILDNLGLDRATLSALRAPAAVPEPASAAILLTVSPLLLKRRTKRRV